MPAVATARAAQATAVDPEKTIAVVNNSGSAFVLFVPTLATGATDPVAGSVANSDLQLLTTVDGKQVVGAGGTGTYVLDQSYTDPKTGKPKYSTLYNLIPSAADWYVPLANIGVMQDIFAEPPSYPKQTVDDTEAGSIRNAGLFYQTISAYPTSALAKSYSDAMSSAVDAGQSAADGSPDSSGKVADSVSGAVDAFFKGTKGFRDVTMAGLVVMETYYRVFPFVWARYDSADYYLYSSDGRTTSFAGVLSLKKPATLDVGKPNAGYALSYAPAKKPSDTTSVDVDSGQARSLTYVDGLFVDNPDADVPNIAVKGTFQVKRFFTQKATDTQVICVLTGTIAGVTVIGFDAPQKSDDKENSEFWDSLFHPKNSSEIFKSVMTIGGAVMLLAFIGQMALGIYRWARSFRAAKEPTTSELLKAQREAIEKSLNEKIDAAVDKLSGGRQQAPKDTQSSLDEIATQRDAVTTNQNAAKLEDGLKSQAETVESLAKSESAMSSSQLNALEDTAGKLKDSMQNLEQATPENLANVVAQETTSLQTIGTQTKGLSTELDTELSADVKASIESNAQLTKEVSESIKESDEISSQDKASDDPVMEDPVEVPAL